MRVLQLGTKNWQKKYKIPKEITWCFKDPISSDVFEKENNKKDERYHLLIITSPIVLKKRTWQLLQVLLPPYDVLIMPGIKTKLDEAAQYFLKCKVAEEIKEDPQTLIDHLLIRYDSGQDERWYSYRYSPTDMQINRNSVRKFNIVDSQHIQFNIKTATEWTTIGTYPYSFDLPKNKLVQFWLETDNRDIQFQLKLYFRALGYDGHVENTKTISVGSTSDESPVPISASSNTRLMTVILQAKGDGQVCLGPLHLSWFREGRGELATGGRRIVNMQNLEELAYYYNPGDLKPPLNVYFSGAEWSSGFEGLNLFQKLKAPALLFTDLRLEAGQFYDDPDGFMLKKIKEIIITTLNKLHFNTKQLILNGASMGSYAALNLGADLHPYVINVAKPITKIGYIASRVRLERPFNYETSLDIAKRLSGSSDFYKLDKLNRQFWEKFNCADLSNTRLFISYKKNDDYDQAITQLIASPAVQHALQFSFKGFSGRHIDGREDINWFVSRLKQVLKNDFNRSVD